MDGDPIIEIRSGGGLRVEVVVSGRLEVGRDCAGLIVDDSLLSRRHLVLTAEGGGVTVEDLHSRNGTSIDAAPVNGPTRLERGQVLLAGGTRIRLSARVATTPPTSAGRAGEDAARNALRDTVARLPILPLEGRAAPTPATPPPTGRIETTAPRLPDPSAGPTPPEPAAPGTDTGLRTTSIRVVADLVSNDPTAAASVHATAGTAATMTFLFSDIEASTERTAAVGDRAWYRLLAAHNDVVEALIDHHAGMVIKSIGDGYMATFDSAGRAARCAASIQQALARGPIGPEGEPIRVRIGLHTGEAIAVGGDLFGFHVNLASRVAEAASGGQVLLSALTRAIIEVSGEVRLGPPHAVRLKGIERTHEVSELLWGDDVHATVLGQPPRPPLR